MTDVGDTSNPPPSAPTPAPIDLTALRSATGSDDPAAPGTAQGISPGYSLDATRQRIAYFLLAILAAIILIQVLSSSILSVACWNTANSGGTCPQAQASLGVLTSVLGTVFTAMVGLVGSVVGFYFGSQKQD